MNHSNSTYSSTGIQQMLINGEQTVNFANMNENKTLYANPYMVLNDKEYTKHYYTEGQRIASKIGAGLSPSIVPYTEKVEPITHDTYEVISDRLYKLCQLSDDCVGFNGEYTNYGKTIKCVKPLAEIDNEEKDRYFYHSDHIGSSSFITDRNGYASQHLQYLPFGELFVEQRSTANYYTPYKFSGKEKDEETSYSYFGARYYMSDVSVWLSVDPLRDDYPYQSPYTYCGWNPVMIIDPDGRGEGNPDVYIDKDNVSGSPINNISIETFNRLQKSTSLPLLYDTNTGQVTIDPSFCEGSIDPCTGEVFGIILSEDDRKLQAAINDHTVIANIETDDDWESAGSYMGSDYYIASNTAKSTNKINPDKMSDLEKTKKSKEGSGILHEVTEGYEAGLISIRHQRNLEKAWVTEGYVEAGNGKKFFSSHQSPDYCYYEIAHDRATLAPGEKRKWKRK